MQGIRGAFCTERLRQLDDQRARRPTTLKQTPAHKIPLEFRDAPWLHARTPTMKPLFIFTLSMKTFLANLTVTATLWIAPAACVVAQTDDVALAADTAAVADDAVVLLPDTAGVVAGTDPDEMFGVPHKPYNGDVLPDPYAPYTPCRMDSAKFGGSGRRTVREHCMGQTCAQRDARDARCRAEAAHKG